MNSEDRRVQRTQTALRTALLQLIRERGYDVITVSDIVERANVGRSTFYAHFAEKADLLQGTIEELRSFLEQQIKISGGGGGAHPALSFCLPMLQHGAENKDLFAALVGHRIGAFFQALMHDMWAGLIRSGWPDADELAVEAIVGAFGSAVSWWLTREPDLDPAEVDRRFRSVMEPGLAALDRAAPAAPPSGTPQEADIAAP